ncbi:MAG: YfhO family protein [Acidobacteria bacterium]|nr:YfhO family protein [Acidobacteriota bacterium]MBV9475975.1 YfhO family protein [Acidobacteriota bacterium]
MTTALLYFATALVCLGLADRYVTRVSRWAAIVLVLLPLAFTGKALLTGRVYAPVDLALDAEPLSWYRDALGGNGPRNGLLSDVYCLNIPWKYAVRRAYAHGELALWNPSLYSGDILAAAAQPTPYEPLFLLSLLLPMANSLTYLAAMTFFIGALLMFLFLRELGCSERASLIGAATWTFGTFLVFWLEWVITSTLYWMPLVLLGVRRIVRDSAARSRSLRGAAILTVAFLMMLLNGHPESALHIVAIGLLWAAGELWAVRGKGFVRAALLGGAAGVVSLLICAVYFLPIVDALPQTYEHSMRAAYYAKLHKSAPLPLAVKQLEAQAIPFIHGQPHSSEWPEQNMPFAPQPRSGYCGSAAVALAAFGAWRSRARVKWVALALVVGGLAFGVQFPPFPDLLAKLPLFDIALNDRLIAAAILGTAILAALGVEAFDRRALAVTALVTAAILGALCANAWPRMRAMGLSERFLVQQTIVFIGAPLLVAMISFSARSRQLACALLLATLVAQRTIEDGGTYPSVHPDLFYPRVGFFKLFPPSAEPYRVTGLSMTLVPNLATMYDLEDVRGYEAMTLRRMKETIPLWSTPQGIWWNRVDDLTNPFLSAMNVRFAVASVDVTPPIGWRRVPGPPIAQLFENTRVLGRAFVPQRVRLVNTPGAALAQMKHARDFGALSWIERIGGVPEERPNGPGRVTTRVPHAGELRIQAVMQRAGWIVVSETAWSGWRATIDGRRAQLRYANHTFLGVYVPAGTHSVRLAYWPRAFVIGAWISGITIAMLALLLTLFTFRRASSPSV